MSNSTISQYHHIEVVSPPEVRAEYIKRLRSMCSFYPEISNPAPEEDN